MFLREMFEASEIYCSIPDYKILGIQQAPFKLRLNELAAQFEKFYKVFVESTYNPLDLKSETFLEDYNVFALKVAELDYKLGTTLAQACLACATPEDSFKLMDTVQDLLKRPIVESEFKKMTTSLLSNIYAGLLAAKESYSDIILQLESGSQIAFKNMPPTSGVLQWSLDLQKKVASPMDFLEKIQNYFVNSEDADLIHRTFKETEGMLSNFQDEIFSKWKVALDAVKEHLDKPLFLKDDNNQLVLNFSPKILDVAQEIRYVKLIKKESLLPAEALDLDVTLNKVLHSHSLLACTSRWYNDLNEILIEFEKELVKEEWEKVCNTFTQGLEFNWTKSDLQEYSEDIYVTTKSLFERINKAKENVQEIQLFIDTWNKSPVYVRDEPDALVIFDMFMTSKMRQQIYKVMETSMNMNRIMEENMALFQCNPESEAWKNYVMYLESIIENGLKDSIKCSLEYIVENTNRDNKKLAPFYKISMVLQEDIRFIPSLDRMAQGSIYKLLEFVIENIYRPTTEIMRMADSEKDYSESIDKCSDLNNLKKKLFFNFITGTEKILAQMVTYQTYADLWLEDIDTVLGDFILYGPLPDTKTNEEEETPELDIPLELKSPSEEEFRTEISQFDMLYKKVEDIAPEAQVEPWLLLDVTSFKDSLLLLIRNWSTAYKKKLVELKSQGKLRKLEDDGDM